MATRSTHVTMRNYTTFNLRKIDDHLDHGIWDVRPPDLIGDRGEWRSESNGVATGTAGRVDYRIEDVDGVAVGTLHLDWKNPFIGSNSYGNSVDPQAKQANLDEFGFSVGRIGGGGDDAEVTFVLLGGFCNVDVVSGEIGCYGISRLTEDSQRYAAIWEQQGGPSWYAKHGLSSTEYQQSFDELVSKGYRLIDVSGYSIKGEDRYAAIWEQRGTPAWQARHGLTSAQYQIVFDQLVGKGYRLVQVSGYSVGEEDRYAAIWELRDGPAWQARHGLTSVQYQQAFDQLASEGYRLVLVNGYSVGEEDRYAAIWELRDGPAWQARHGLTSAQYQQAFGQLVSEGYRLIQVSGYGIKGEDRYAAIWEQSAGPAWQARHGLTSVQYQEAFDQLVKDGYRLIQVSGYSVH